MSAEEQYEPTPIYFNTPSTEWLVVHGLGRPYTYTAFDATGKELEGEHEPVDSVSFKLKFNSAVSGYVTVT